jgi:hypothetical protein
MAPSVTLGGGSWRGDGQRSKGLAEAVSGGGSDALAAVHGGVFAGRHDVVSIS